MAVIMQDNSAIITSIFLLVSQVTQFNNVKQLCHM